MYPTSTSPRYIPGGTADTVICLLVALLALILRFVHIRENQKLEILERESADREGRQAGDGVDEDRRAVGFRYVY